MHGHCRRFLLSSSCVWLPFQLPLHYAATHLRMIGGELGACPGQVGRGASVPGKNHPSNFGVPLFFFSPENLGNVCKNWEDLHLLMVEQHILTLT